MITKRSGEKWLSSREEISERSGVKGSLSRVGCVCVCKGGGEIGCRVCVSVKGGNWLIDKVC